MHNVDTLVVKVASRCNLACTYCYEYSSGDDSWRGSPRVLSEASTRQLGQRIAEYAAITGRKSINVVAHGGEPLAMGPQKLNRFFATLREEAPSVSLRFSIQTNRVLITPAHCDVIKKHGVIVGISLDGDEYANRHRIDLMGRPTWGKVIEGLRLLKELAPDRFGGILCVVDPSTDPNEVINALCLLNPPQIDLLQPFLTHDQAGIKRAELAASFGRWMIAGMRTWLSNPAYKDIRIRVFEDAFRIALQAPTRTDWFGPRTISYLVINTDGTYDLLDQLKVIGAESSKVRSLGLSIESSSIIDASARAEALLNKFQGKQTPTDCGGCQLASSCSGSHLTSRFSSLAGFNNASTYCEGIQMIVEAAKQEIARSGLSTYVD